MVSMADEEGRLVLVGVDATYCVVDEVDTTASLSDSFLREAIEDAQTEANEEAAAVSDTENDLEDPYLQEAIKNAAKNVTDLLLRGKIRLKDREKNTHSNNHELETAEVEEDNGSIAEENGETGEDVKPTALLGQSSSTLLRAALLSRPVSLREPNIPGPLNFCPTQDIEGNPNVADAEGTADTGERGSNSAEANSNVKSKSKRSGSRRKPSAPKRVRLLKPNLSEPFSDESTSAAVHVFVAAEEEETKLCEEKKEEGGEEEGDKPKAKPKRSREKPYQCGICSRWFGCKSHVVEHMRTHTGEKPFQCTLCDKRFSQKSNIYQHMNTHTKERPFRCNDCGKDFMYRGSLYKHKRLHTGERPYTCGLCSRRFTHASQLFEHLRTHTNERPFKCGVCGRAFAHSGTMHRHQRNHFSQLKKVRKVNRSDVEGQEDIKGDITLEGSKEVKNLQEDINHNLESYVPPVDVAVTAEKTSETESAQQNVEKSAQNSPPDLLTASADSGKKEGDRIADRLNNNEISSAESGKNVSEPAEKAADQNGNEVTENEGNGTSPSKEDKLTSDASNTKSSSDLLGISSIDMTNENASSTPTSTPKQAPNPPKKPSRRKSKTLDANGTPTDKPKRTRIETPDRKVFSCDLCGHCFCHKRSVKRHKQAVHPEVIGEDGQVIPTADSEMAVSPATEDTEEEMETESKEVLRAQLTSVSLLKSLLTMTRNSYNNNNNDDNNNNNNSDGHSVADLAALRARRIGEASANLQAIAQLCSQKDTEDGGLTLPQALLDASLSNGLVKSLLHGKGNSQSSAAEHSLNVRIKSEPSSDDYVIENPAGNVVDSGVGEEMEEMRTELHSDAALGSGNVVVKTEPVESSECA